jgi:hypothetical protein
MPCVGFEPTIPDLERATTVHALDRADTVIGFKDVYNRTIVPTLHSWPTITHLIHRTIRTLHKH